MSIITKSFLALFVGLIILFPFGRSDEVTSSHAETIYDCIGKCTTYLGCNWMSYDYNSKVCVAIKKQPSCSAEATRSIHEPMKNYSKVFVAVGQIESKKNNEVEIIDLLNPNIKCDPISKFPLSGMGSMGGIGPDKNPVVCGGFGRGPGGSKTILKDCFSLSGGTWRKAAPMTKPRLAGAVAFSPIGPDHSTLFVTGGADTSGSERTSEVLTSTGWHITPLEFPTATLMHCLVQMNSTHYISTGGTMEDNYPNLENETHPVSPRTLVYDINQLSQIWSEGPPMNTGRTNHGCGMIKKSETSSEKSVIVVGGSNGWGLDLVPYSTTEIFDEETKVWRFGPALPHGISNGVLVQDPSGGVVLIGGFKSSRGNNTSYLSTLYKLRHAEAQWELMPQTLKFGRNFHTAFLIPDDLVNCREE